MKEPLLPLDEADRLQALYDYDVLDTDFEAEFDDLVKLASQICDAPISLISLVEKERQWFKAVKGLDARETSRQVSFCAHAIHGDEIFLIEDATKDERFIDNPLVLGDPNIRFYAGMPLITPDNHKIGTLCVIDDKPRSLSENQKFALETLSHQVIKLLEHKIKIREIEQQKRQIVYLDEQKNQVLSMILNDIQVPLTILEDTLSFFSQEELSEDEFKYMFSDTGNAIQRTNHLLANIAYWTETQLKAEKITLEDINLSEMINKEDYAFEKMSRDKKIELSNEIPSSVSISSHPNTLKLIIRNLLLNAYSRGNAGKITITYQEEGEGKIIRFIDNGSLLNEDQIAYILNWKDNKQEIAPHQGINLVLAQALAKQIGASILAEENSNEGMTFALIISS